MPLEPVPLHPSGWQPAHGSVLLIDKIDKADTDLPNGLLETLGNGDVPVPYLRDSVRQTTKSPPPLVILTTNEERELPAAFLRRCLVLPMQLPKGDQELIDFLCQRGVVHFQRQCSAKVYQRASVLLYKTARPLWHRGCPVPGQAEYLDLLRAVTTMQKGEKGQLALLDEISSFVLQKSSAAQS